ncbi:MAG: hypothetical protein PWQ82_316 [Thermosediminibacterales bacterium]|nr:hypothetical protein [Thermosediminibacterales bacterium]MDK2836402.1 hypothetical protein [Thermosediminibacterales bacterium]
MKGYNFNAPIVMVVSGVLLILVIVFQVLTTGSIPLNSLKNQQVKQHVKTSPLDVDTFLSYGDKWVIYRTLEGISGENLETGKTWKSEIYPPQNKVWTGSNGFAVMENDCITAFSFKGDKIWSYTVKHKLSKFFGPVDGFALLEEQSDQGSRVIAIDPKGETLWEFPLDNLKLITAGMLPDKTFVLSLLELNNSIESKILKFNEKGELLWALGLAEAIVPFIGVHEKGIAALESNRIISISQDGKITKEIVLESIIRRAAFSKTGLIGVSFNKAARSSILKTKKRNVIELYDLNGNKKWGFELENEVKGIEFGKEKPMIITYTENEIFGISEQGALLWEIPLDEKIDKIYVSGEGLPAVLKTSKKLLLLNYKGEPK